MDFICSCDTAKAIAFLLWIYVTKRKDVTPKVELENLVLHPSTWAFSLWLLIPMSCSLCLGLGSHSLTSPFRSGAYRASSVLQGSSPELSAMPDEYLQDSSLYRSGPKPSKLEQLWHCVKSFLYLVISHADTVLIYNNNVFELLLYARNGPKLSMWIFNVILALTL